jgi:hypothetical protein
MSRLFETRLGFAVLGGLAAVSVLIAVVVQMDESGLSRLYNIGQIEWFVPIAVGASVGLVAWSALGGLSGDDSPSHTEAACPACGRPILDDWRLCPDCGTLVTHSATTAVGGSAQD